MKLPYFKYHPDPLKTGALEKSDKKCECCEKVRGYISIPTPYTRKNVSILCPWCISDGSAHKKFKATFTADYDLVKNNIHKDIIKEVLTRTISYSSWQQDIWQSHCDDGCEYHGDATIEDVKSIQGKDLEDFLERFMLDKCIWEDILKKYEPVGNPAIYKFVCRHCDKKVFTMDYLM